MTGPRELWTGIRDRARVLRSIDRWLLGALIVGLAARIGWQLYVDAQPTSDALVYFDHAERLANGLGYVFDGRPTAYIPVGYPATLAAFFEVFGVHVWVGKLVNILAFIAIVSLTYLIGRELYGRPAARIAAWIMALLPSQVFVSTLLFSEPLFTAIQLAAVYLLLLGFRRAPDASVARPGTAVSAATALFLLPELDKARLIAGACLVVLLGLAVYGWRRDRVLLLWGAAGVVTGYALLVRPAGLTIVLAALVATYILARRMAPWHPGDAQSLPGPRVSRSPVLKYGGVYLLGAALLVLPWLARNQAEIGIGANISTNGGLNVLVGNHDGATGCFSFDDEDRFLFLIADEVERDRKALEESLEFTQEDPLQALSLLPLKFNCTWREDAISVYWNSFDQEDTPGRIPRAMFSFASNWAYYGLLFLAFLGIPAWWLRKPGHLLLPLLVGFTAIYYTLVLGDPRYHEPLLPFFAIWAACGILFVPRWLRSARERPADE
ncbi:MAG: glycosyltransferase family 39 protein [Dehalococcoidia bacterium]